MNGFLIRHSQLGLGKVTAIKNGALHIRFLDSGQQHAFAPAGFRSGLLVRERLGRGTRCCAGDTTIGVIERLAVQATGEAGEAFAYELLTADGEMRVYSEIDLEPISGAQSADPLLRFAGLQPQPYPLFKSRDALRSAYARLLHDGAGLRALLASRVDLRPHQAFVAGTVILDPRRRYILADEVGLGKTIEAGIVIHDLLAQKPDAKILILCPGALTQQWLSELYSKFGGQLFTLIDLHHPFLLNWAGVRKAIVSTTLAGYRVGPILEKIKWDMVVVDEVHHLLASRVLYQLVERLSRHAPSLLLLSAIPAHEREDEFLRLLALLEPERYSNPEVKRRFATLFALQTQLGRGLRVLVRRIDGYEKGELAAAELSSIARRILELDVVNEDRDLHDRLEAIQDAVDEAEAVPAQSTVDRGLSESISHPVPIHSIPAVTDVQGLTKEATGDGRARIDDSLSHVAIANEFRHWTHEVADRYRINRRILRNRRQRLIEQDQVAQIERNIRHEPFAPDQLELDAFESIDALLRETRDAGIDADLLTSFSRTLLQSASSPRTALSLLLELQRTSGKSINEEGRELVLMGHTVGYSDWELYQGLLYRLIKDQVPARSLTRAVNAVRAWESSSGGLSMRMQQLLSVIASRITEVPNSKLLVFAGFPGLAGEVVEAATQRFGVAAVTEFRSDLEPEQKESNVRRLQYDPRTRIMVSDESGGEGRNFQFASELIHVDTPWHTARVEQRIGRLDRLGRESFYPDVTSIVVYNAAASEAGLVHCLDVGIGVYRRSISGLEFALRQVERDLLSVAIDSGRDGLIDHAAILRSVVEGERAQDESEAVLDEASFERSSATRYRAVARSDRTDKNIESAVLDYFRELTANTGVHDLQDSEYPRQIWRLRPETSRYGALPVDGRQAQGLTGVFDGTFRRAVAQRRPQLHFFSIGDPLFDSVIRSLDVQATGRTYAIECALPEAEPWMGCEFSFLAIPDFAKLIDSPGLTNQASSVFLPKVTRVFISLEGVLEPNDELLLTLRRHCEFKNRGKTWWELSGEDRSYAVRAAVGARDWQETILHLYSVAQKEAEQRIIARHGDHVRLELARLADAEHQFAALAARGDESARADAEAMASVRAAVMNWCPVLDSVGFLSVNGLLRLLPNPR